MRPDEAIELVGLAEKRDARSSSLSGGQRRRLDVALGIVGRPELLFLDEPTTGFDPEARRQFWGLIESLADAGTTILLTTHYLDEAERLADRVAVINAGRILEVGAAGHARRPGLGGGHRALDRPGRPARADHRRADQDGAGAGRRGSTARSRSWSSSGRAWKTCTCG